MNYKEYESKLQESLKVLQEQSDLISSLKLEQQKGTKKLTKKIKKLFKIKTEVYLDEFGFNVTYKGNKVVEYGYDTKSFKDISKETYDSAVALWLLQFGETRERINVYDNVEGDILNVVNVIHKDLSCVKRPTRLGESPIFKSTLLSQYDDYFDKII